LFFHVWGSVQGCTFSEVILDEGKLEGCKGSCFVGTVKVNRCVKKGVKEFPGSFRFSDCISMVVVTAKEGLAAVMSGKGVKSGADMSADG